MNLKEEIIKNTLSSKGYIKENTNDLIQVIKVLIDNSESVTFLNIYPSSNENSYIEVMHKGKVYEIRVSSAS